ncbi:Lsr2 family protein [Nocardia sp. NPDC051570]|uniref:Lsr2 family protein n=1 Tax=Nocardia sp. NPDC051570 TaxID=3364324 RepID=UPI0037B59DB1
MTIVDSCGIFTTEGGPFYGEKVVVELIDDFDGSSIARETMTFGLDGTTYEIDLSMRNAGKLRALFEPWTDNARKVGRIPKGKSAARPTGKREETQAIREWAGKNGHKVSARGRISADVVAAYRKATP